MTAGFAGKKKGGQASFVCKAMLHIAGGVSCFTLGEESSVDAAAEHGAHCAVDTDVEGVLLAAAAPPGARARGAAAPEPAHRRGKHAKEGGKRSEGVCCAENVSS